MMKKLFTVFCLSLLTFGVVNHSFAQRGKAEIGLSYGYYSYFTLYQGQPFNTTGTTNISMRYYLSNNVTVGLNVGYENIDSWGSLLTFAPEFTFKYLDTKDDRIRVRLYGLAAYGLSVFNDNNLSPGHIDNTGAKLWGFQFTPFGIRVGRKFAGFAEVGLGYKGLINAGLSYRFRAVKHTVVAEH